jgi:hypothetical protein
VPSLDRRILALTVCPAAVVLVLAALSERAGSETATFYLLLAGVPLAAVGALVALARLVDVGGRRLEASLAGGLVVCFCVGAAARSPVFLDAGSGPIVPVALGAGFAVLALLALAAAAPLRR